MRKLWEDEAWKEYLEWQMKDKKVLKRINQLLTDIDRNGYQCIGKPEPLSGIFQVTGVSALMEKIGLFLELLTTI